MTRDAITRQREAYANAQAAVQPFVAAWRALRSGLSDGQLTLYEKRCMVSGDSAAVRSWARHQINAQLKSPAVELCDAMDAMNDAANDALMAYPDSGVTFEQELNA